MSSLWPFSDGRIGLEGQHGILDHLAVVDQEVIDIVQRVGDRLLLAPVGDQHGDAVFIQRHGRRARRPAHQCDRGHSRQALKFDADHGVLAQRRGVVQQDESHDLARVLQLDRLDQASGHAVEGD